MSNHFNEKAFESIDKITSALLAAHEQLPQDLVQCGHFLHRAIDDFAEICTLYRHGGIALAQDELHACKRQLAIALELLTAASVSDTHDDAPDFCEDDNWEKPRFGLIEFCGD